MSLTKQQVTHVAHLARIRVSEAEADRLSGDLSRILGWVEQLGEVDTDGVEPMRSVTPMAAKLRADAITDGRIPDQVLANAPETAESFYVVPKVVE